MKCYVKFQFEEESWECPVHREYFNCFQDAYKFYEVLKDSKEVCWASLIAEKVGVACCFNFNDYPKEEELPFN